MVQRRPSPQAIRLLASMLSEPRSWRYGYDISKETGLAAGTLYPLLDRLLKQGVLESEWKPSELEGRPPRHAYRLTRSGAAFAASAIAAEIKQAPFTRLRPARS